MLERIPRSIGRALSSLRAGERKVAYFSGPRARLPAAMSLRSPAFAAGGPIPSTYTADGAGLSPPLAWSGIPGDAAALCLLIEDADAPTPSPLVHGIVGELPAGDGELAEGELNRPSGRFRLGKNSFMQPAYLPPDPLPGHGLHRYYFQIYALDRRPQFAAAPGRSELVRVIDRHGVAKGLLLGTYSRDR
jgi:hypothetical protein